LELGNLEAKRDWGHARDYVKAMYLMIQHANADDYVIATGRMVSVREFCRLAFEHVGLVPEDHIRASPHLMRPAEVDVLQGDASKARAVLDWKPETALEDLVAEMVEADLERHRAAQTADKVARSD